MSRGNVQLLARRQARSSAWSVHDAVCARRRCCSTSLSGTTARCAATDDEVAADEACVVLPTCVPPVKSSGDRGAAEAPTQTDDDCASSTLRLKAQCHRAHATVCMLCALGLS